MTYRDLYWQSRDGLRLHARDHVAEPVTDAITRLPVICIPGLTRNAADFDAIGAWLSSLGHRVLAVSLRGRAGSAHAPRASYRPPVYADDVLALMRAEGIERALFIGTSLGVLVTMTIATKQRGAVAAAVLNDAGPEVSSQSLQRIAAYAGSQPAPMSREAAAAHVQRLAQPVYPRMDAADFDAMVDRMFRRDEAGLWVLDYDPAIIRTLSPWKLRLLRPLLWHAYRRLARGCPVLLVRGAHSDILAADLAQRMVAAVPGTRFVQVPDVGHAPTLSEPEARDAIGAFVTDAGRA